MTPFIYVVAPTVLTFGLPPPHLGNSSKLDCARFVVGYALGAVGGYNQQANAWSIISFLSSTR